MVATYDAQVRAAKKGLQGAESKQRERLQREKDEAVKRRSAIIAKPIISAVEGDRRLQQDTDAGLSRRKTENSSRVEGERVH